MFGKWVVIIAFHNGNIFKQGAMPGAQACCFRQSPFVWWAPSWSVLIVVTCVAFTRHLSSLACASSLPHMCVNTHLHRTHTHDTGTICGTNRNTVISNLTLQWFCFQHNHGYAAPRSQIYKLGNFYIRLYKRLCKCMPMELSQIKETSLGHLENEGTRCLILNLTKSTCIGRHIERFYFFL